MKFATIAAAVCLPLILPASDHKWASKDYTQWTAAETDRVLSDSPWVKVAHASYGTTDEDARDYPVKEPGPREGGLGGRGASDGYWDGGVGRMQTGGDPKLPVAVRWDSALPVREALLKMHAPEGDDTANTLEKPEKYYVIALIGLAAGRKKPSENKESDQFEMSRTRQGLLNESRLMRKDKNAIVPADARIEESTGVVRIFFPKTDPITLEDEEVVFGTTYGSIRVIQRFRLKDMIYRGKLEL